MTTFKEAQRSRSKPVARSKRAPKVKSEDQEQITLMSWAHHVKFGNGRLSDYLIHIPNGGSRFSSYITISQGIRNSVPKEENKLWDYMYTADNALYNVKQHKKGEIVLLHSAVISQKSLADAKRT